MATHAFTNKQAIRFGYETFKKNWKFLVISFFIVLVVGMIPSILQDNAVENNQDTLSFVFSLLGWFVQAVTSIGLIIICLKLVDGKKPLLEDIYSHYRLTFNYILGSIIYGAVCLVGFILLIVPGIIWGIKYQYTTYLIVDKKMGPIEAFKKSGQLTKGVKLKLFYLGLLFVGIMLLGILALGVGILVAWPIISLSSAFVYRKLSPHTH